MQSKHFSTATTHSNRRPEPEVVIRVLDTNKRDADTVGIIHLNGVQTI